MLCSDGVNFSRYKTIHNTDFWVDDNYAKKKHYQFNSRIKKNKINAIEMSNNLNLNHYRDL